MSHSAVVHDTFVINRSYPHAPERVFKAFADAAQKRRWYAEGNSHDVEEFQLDFRCGGSERIRYRIKKGSPVEGLVVSNSGTFQDIVPNRRVVTAYAMSFGDQRISATLVTVELVPTDRGTDLICTHQGAFFEGSDGPQIRQLGWKNLFEKLDKELSRG